MRAALVTLILLLASPASGASLYDYWWPKPKPAVALPLPPPPVIVEPPKPAPPVVVEPPKPAPPPVVVAPQPQPKPAPKPSVQHKPKPQAKASKISSGQCDELRGHVRKWGKQMVINNAWMGGYTSAQAAWALRECGL